MIFSGEFGQMIYLFEELDIFHKNSWTGPSSAAPKTKGICAALSRLQIRSSPRWAGFFWLMEWGRNTERKKFRISRKPPQENLFLPGKICPFLISATADPLWAADCTGKKSGWIFRSWRLLSHSLCKGSARMRNRHLWSLILISAGSGLKESVGKLTGEGITSSFRDILVLHPEIHTRTIPLENGAGFLAYSTYSGRELPVMKVSAKQLLAELS